MAVASATELPEEPAWRQARPDRLRVGAIPAIESRNP